MNSEYVESEDGRTFLAAGQDRFLIGRGADCDIRLSSPFVSRRHAILERDGGGGWFVHPEAPSNAVVVRGRQIAGPTALSADGLVEVAGVRLVVVGDHRFRPTSTLVAGRPTVTIGRSTENDVVVDDVMVSKFHARLIQADGTTVIEDLGSRNGTRVDGEIVERAVVRPGATLGIGRQTFTMAPGGQPISRAVGRPVLTVDEIEVVIECQPRLQSVSLAVYPGDYVAVIGESGSGKTTLLRALTGEIAVDRGSVEVGGEPLATRRWDVGYVRQHPTLHKQLAAEEILAYAAQLRLPPDFSDAERATHVAALLCDLELQECKHVRFGRLSGGQQKRVPVASELVSEPSVLILDEPDSGLDSVSSRHLFELLRRRASGGRAVIVVTHSSQDLELFSRLVILRPGGILAYDGPPDGAIRQFGGRTYSRLLAQVKESPDRPVTRPITGMRVAAAPAALVRDRQARALPGLGAEAAVLMSRQWRLIVRDRLNLGIMLAQAPAIGASAALLFGRATFSARGEITKSAQLLFLLTFAITMFGTLLGTRDLIREREIIARERVQGVRAISFLASKFAVLGSCIALQAVLLVVCTFLVAPLHADTAAYLNVGGLLILTGVAGAMAGLALSALARTETQAVSALNLLLIPQLLLGGAIISVSQMGNLGFIAGIAPSRWAYSGVGGSIHLAHRGVHNAGFSRFYKGFFDIEPGVAAGVLVAFACLFATMVFRQLRELARAQRVTG